MQREWEYAYITNQSSCTHSKLKRITMKKTKMRAIALPTKKKLTANCHWNGWNSCGWLLYDFIWYNYTKYENWNRLQLARTTSARNELRKNSYLINYYSVKLSTVVAAVFFSFFLFLCTYTRHTHLRSVRYYCQFNLNNNEITQLPLPMFAVWAVAFFAFFSFVALWFINYDRYHNSISYVSLSVLFCITYNGNLLLLLLCVSNDFVTLDVVSKKFHKK